MWGSVGGSVEKGVGIRGGKGRCGGGKGRCGERCREVCLLRCGGDKGRCGEVLGEMWESALGCGGGKGDGGVWGSVFQGGVGKCVGVYGR